MIASLFCIISEIFFFLKSATIVGSNNLYWKNVKSDLVSIVHVNELELNLNDIVPAKAESESSLIPATSAPDTAASAVGVESDIKTKQKVNILIHI